MAVTAESLEAQFGDEGYDFGRLELQGWIDAVMDELESLPDEDRVDYLSALQEVDPDGWAMIVHEVLGMRDENRPVEPPTETRTYQPPPWDWQPGGPPGTGPQQHIPPSPSSPVQPSDPRVPGPSAAPPGTPTPDGPPGTGILDQPTPPPFSPEIERPPGGPGTVTPPPRRAGALAANQGWFPDILGEGMTPPSYTPGTDPIEQIPTPQSPHEEQSPLTRGFMNSLAQQTRPATQQQLEQWKRFSMAQMPQGR